MEAKEFTTLAAYTDTSYQIWVNTPQGGVWAYRVNVTYSIAQAWSAEWNKEAPHDVPEGSTFFAVKATTSFERI
jgi:hypothetical protein